MKVSLNWLKEFIDVPETVTAQEIAQALTLSTVEVEGIIEQEPQFQKMQVGKVVELKEHPEADKVQIAIVDLGDATHEIVCGGINLSAGMLVAVAEPGSFVRWHGEGEPVKLKKAKIRGVESYGMICASSEIGLAELFPADDERIIIDLSGIDAAPGTPLAQALGLTDIILDIDNKSLTNRPDLWGVYGMAREVAAIFDIPLKPLPAVDIPDCDDAELTVSIKDTGSCYRYIGAIIDNVKIQESPFWMKTRLVSVGQKPINLLVDLTNYVMFAVGQPLHAFDRRNVAGTDIQIRKAKDEEQLTLIDESEMELCEKDLVIADCEKSIALAGVMGGLHFGIQGDTAQMILEAASFEPVGVRRTALRHGLRTESSSRFEKGIDSERCGSGANLFVYYLLQEQPEAKILKWVDSYPVKPERISVQVDREFINSRVGHTFSSEQIEAILARLGFRVTRERDSFDCCVPAWRATGDVSIPEDIVEEVVRIYGYNELEPLPLKIEFLSGLMQPRQTMERGMRQYLAYTAGLYEVYTYPWVEASLLEASGLSQEAALPLYAPPSPERKTLRNSLIPELLGGIEKNLRFFDQVGIFESTRIFSPDKRRAWSNAEEQLPEQPKVLAAAMTGGDTKEVFYRVKGIVEGLFSAVQVSGVALCPAADCPGWTSPERSLAIEYNGERIGTLGLATPRVLRKLALERIQVGLFEFVVDAVEPPVSPSYTYKPLPKYPPVDFDLAVVFPEETTWTEIAKAAAGVSPLVKKVTFVDEYRGEQVPKGKKSIALQILLIDPKATLEGSKVQEVMDSVLARFKKKLGGELRQ